MKKILGVIITLAVFSSCTKDLGKPTPIVQIDSCTTDISYTKQIVPLINQSCALSGCHVTGGYKSFSDHNSLKSVIDNTSSFVSRFKPGGGMPPSYSTGPPLTDCQISKLESWIKQGALNN
ncbi:MAG: hypothetical protein Q8T03_06285 [Bacteroidota bacterium]|nr:hypothetical protein [Bacteroidota bacterium]